MSNKYKPYEWQVELADEMLKYKGGVIAGRTGYPQRSESIIMSLVNMAKKHMIKRELQEFVDKKISDKE